nr:hypothetical protein [Iodidimonas gelatinilytica]
MANDLRFLFIDDSISTLYLPTRIYMRYDIIAISLPARAFSPLNLTNLTAPDFFLQGFEKQCIHGALKANMKLVYSAFFCRPDGNAEIDHFLIEPGYIGLIARETVKGFCSDHGKALRIGFHCLKHGLKAGAVGR